MNFIHVTTQLLHFVFLKMVFINAHGINIMKTTNKIETKNNIKVSANEENAILQKDDEFHEFSNDKKSRMFKFLVILR
jgi:hypothetical protein